MQDKFKEEPVVLVTSEHLRTGKEYDAALIWTEDVTKDSFKVCLRELQNFDGKHEDISVVRTYITTNSLVKLYVKRKVNHLTTYNPLQNCKYAITDFYFDLSLSQVVVQLFLVNSYSTSGP